jgi:trk system potassium uptake protein TrkA
MKFLIIGLGNFGSSIAKELTDMGHEVIAVDSDIQKVEMFKEEITSTICMNCNDQHALSSLPLKDTDVAIVCIGEDFGSSIMATAILKKNRVNRIICRATSVLHESVLQSIGVDDIVFPEQETAVRLSRRLQLKGVIDSYQADESHFIIKTYLPEIYDGLTIEEINFKANNLIFLAVLDLKPVENIFGEKTNKYIVNNAKKESSTKLTKNDLIMVYGMKKNINNFFQL